MLFECIVKGMVSFFLFKKIYYSNISQSVFLVLFTLFKKIKYKKHDNERRAKQSEKKAIHVTFYCCNNSKRFRVFLFLCWLHISSVYWNGYCPIQLRSREKRLNHFKSKAYRLLETKVFIFRDVAQADPVCQWWFQFIEDCLPCQFIESTMYSYLDFLFDKRFWLPPNIDSWPPEGVENFPALRDVFVYPIICAAILYCLRLAFEG